MYSVAPAKRFNTHDLEWHLSEEYLERYRRRLAAEARLGPTARAASVRPLQVVPPAPQVIKIKEIIASIEDLRVTTLPGKAIVQGTIVEQIFFVAPSDIVQERVVRTPFAQQVEIPGLDPDKIAAGTQALDVTAEVEFVIAHLLDPIRVKDKIVLLLTFTLTEKMPVGGASLDVVIFSKKEQVLVVAIKEFPVKQVQVAQIPQAAVISQQMLLEERKPLQAIKIKRVDAELRGVDAQTLPGKVIVTGIVHKQVQFVGPDNIVRMIEEDLPFTHVKEIPGVTPEVPVPVVAEVEFVIPELDPARGLLIQKIVLRFRFFAPDRRFVTVVTDVTGPGITTDKVVIRVDGTELAVVTDVHGPGIVSVTKGTIVAVVVGSPNPNPQPVVVVTDVVLADP